jgi:hypothetical protein
MKLRYIQGFTLLIVANCLAAPAANAYLVTIDQFTIMKNGNTIWSDSFDDGISPVTNEDYIVSGTPGPESGGVLNMDIADAVPHTGVTGNDRLRIRVRKKTSTGSDPTQGLRTNDTFSVAGIFDVNSLLLSDEQYGVHLSDGVGVDSDDKLDMFVKHTIGGSMMIQFRRQDYINHTLTILEEVAFASGSNDQILLMLSRLNTGNNEITASFAYGLGGIFGATTTFSTIATIFNGEDFTRAQFVATGPAAVPVPAAVWLFGSGLLGLIGVARRKKTA